MLFELVQVNPELLRLILVFHDLKKLFYRYIVRERHDWPAGTH